MHHSNDSRSAIRRSILPITLVAIGVTMLVGCIYIPATHMLQVNGDRRPEHLVGRGNKIEPGKTHIVDALIAVRRQIYGDQETSPVAYYASKDGRQFSMSYQLRAGTTVYPLCFFWGEADARYREIVLAVDDNQVVVGTATTDATQSHFNNNSESPPSVELFDADERARLEAAGLVLWRDEFDKERKTRNELWQRLQQAQSRAVTKPIESPSVQP